MNLLKLIKKIPKIRIVITLLYPILFPILSFFAKSFVSLSSFFYFLLMKMDWGKIPSTEWMDHDQDTFYQFNSNGSFLHFERGIIARMYLSNFLLHKKDFKLLKLKKKLNILDLCSGDSYISQKFFFDVSKNIVSLDLDSKALQRGKSRLKKNNYLNQSHYFFQMDIEKEKIGSFLRRKNLNLKFDLVLFNAAIEHFKEQQLDFIFLSFKEVMKKKSFLNTYTIVEDKNHPTYLPDHHEMFFSNKEHLQKVVSKYFKFTKSHHTLVNKRWNIYCVASDQKIEL